MKYLLLIPTLLLAIICDAQYYTSPVANGNPNNINQEDLEYPLGGGLPSGWNSILSGGKNNPTWSSTETIPFAFQFNDTAVTAFKASSSGVVTFTTSTTGSVPSHTNASLPSSSIPDNSICVWGVSGKGPNDAIVTKTFGTAPNRQLWISYNNYSEASIFVNHYTYFSVVLEENSNRIYIVDQRNFGATPSLTLGIQINSTESYQIAGSPNYNPQANNSPARTDNKYYTFNPGAQVTNDAFLKSIEINDALFLSSAPFSIDVTIENTGVDTITSAEIAMSIDGGAPVISNATNLSIPTNSEGTFNIANSWSPSSKGTYEIKTWVETINTISDQNNQNDTLVKNVTIYGNENRRFPLIETFTSSTSPTSKTSNSHIETFVSNNQGDVTSLKYHMNSPGTGDPYFTSEGLNRNQYYSVQAVNSVLIDGDMQMYSQQLNQDSIDERLDNVAFVEIDATFWIAGKIVYITADVNPLETFSGQNYVLYAAIFENTTTQNAKTSGETEFYHVMKKMVPNANGTFLGGLNKSASVSHSLNYQFKGNYRLPSNANNQINHASEHSVEQFSDLGVVLWVQDNDTKEILQSAYAENTIGIDENKLSSFKLFPNPATEQVTVSFLNDTKTAKLAIYTVDGREVFKHSANNISSNELEINTSELAPGVYIIQVNTSGKISTNKLIIE
jgi:hypothetical protein